MSMTVTLICMAVAGLLLGLASWRARKPYVPGKPPLLPYGLIQFAAIVVILVLAGHVITLVTGTPYRGRFGWGDIITFTTFFA